MANGTDKDSRQGTTHYVNAFFKNLNNSANVNLRFKSMDIL